MTSNSQDGRCSEEHGEKLYFAHRMEGSIQIILTSLYRDFVVTLYNIHSEKYLISSVILTLDNIQCARNFQNYN